jgi:protein-tyrosine phosphatase
MRAIDDSKKQQIIDRIRKNPRLLMICYGNIMRSPYAQAFLSNMLQKRGVDNIEVTSAGLLGAGYEDRLAHPYAKSAAAQDGADLSKHRSKPVTQDMIDKSGIVLVMDSRNYHDVISSFKKTEGKVFFLGAFGSSDNDWIEISDPYFAQPDTVSEVFHRIKQSCIKLGELLIEDTH